MQPDEPLRKSLLRSIKPSEVRTAMIEAMTEGFNSKDPSARAMWAQIPCEGEMPTPEELIAWVGKGLNGGQFS